MAEKPAILVGRKTPIVDGALVNVFAARYVNGRTSSGEFDAPDIVTAVADAAAHMGWTQATIRDMPVSYEGDTYWPEMNEDGRIVALVTRPADGSRSMAFVQPDPAPRPVMAKLRWNEEAQPKRVHPSARPNTGDLPNHSRFSWGRVVYGVILAMIGAALTLGVLTWGEAVHAWWSGIDWYQTAGAVATWGPWALLFAIIVGGAWRRK